MDFVWEIIELLFNHIVYQLILILSTKHTPIRNYHPFLIYERPQGSCQNQHWDYYYSPYTLIWENQYQPVTWYKLNIQETRTFLVWRNQFIYNFIDDVLLFITITSIFSSDNPKWNTTTRADRLTSDIWEAWPGNSQRGLDAVSFYYNIKVLQTTYNFSILN